jgi:NAD(P)-dependent dehydrogenase (short-subunit alcohol dehydrogenase family)
MVNESEIGTHKAKAAVITGAAQGLGRAIALRLAQDGYDISVSGRPTRILDLELLAEEIKAIGRKAIAVPCDVSKEEDVEILIQRTVDELGPLRIVSLP